MRVPFHIVSSGQLFLRIRNVFLEWCLAKAAVSTAKALFATISRNMHLAEPETSPYILPESTTFIYSVWHDSLLMPLFLGRQPATMALVGMHQDGTFLANSLRCLGIPCIRGSSSRGGAEAVHKLLELAKQHHIVITPDGPRGPRREMKAGLAYIASRSGKPVVPTAFSCRRAWAIGSGWTDLAVPKPWTTVFALTGRRQLIPPEASSEELRHYTHQIQTEMDRLNKHASAMASAKTAKELQALILEIE